jgi:hypothetical protein
LRRQLSLWAFSGARNSLKSIGWFWVHMLVHGERKSGTLDSVLIPAPVKTTVF